jgi:tetratricopeptide (TPR) repeat protein
MACARLAKRGRLDRLVDVYHEAERGHPNFMLAEKLQHQLARLLERSLRLEEAERAWRTLAVHFPNSRNAALALYSAARLADETGDAFRAVQTRRQLVELYPETSEAQMVAVRDLQYAA